MLLGRVLAELESEARGKHSMYLTRKRKYAAGAGRRIATMTLPSLNAWS